MRKKVEVNFLNDSVLESYLVSHIYSSARRVQKYFYYQLLSGVGFLGSLMCELTGVVLIPFDLFLSGVCWFFGVFLLFCGFYGDVKSWDYKISED